MFFVEGAAQSAPLTVHGDDGASPSSLLFSL